MDQLIRGRDEVRARHEAGASGIDATRRLSDLVDRLINVMFRLAIQDLPPDVRRNPQITIAATGGYGRRRLAPFSDIDVSFIVSEEDDPVREAIAKDVFLRMSEVLTDGVGLTVGYAYRTPRDLEHVDTNVQTALLDARWVAGDRALFYRFRDDLIRYIRPAVFVWHKMDDRLQARKRHGDSVYLVEPNIKMGAGGLRDLHTAEWLAKATMGIGLDDAWRLLRARGLIADDEFAAITQGRDFLLRVRNGLHWLAGYEQDALTAHSQHELAEQLGYRDTPTRSAVQTLMSDYYEHAATIQRISRKVAAKSLIQPLRLDDGLVMKSGQITPTDLTLMERDPSAALRVLHLAQKYDFPLSPQVEEIIGDHMARTDEQLDDPDSRRLFVQILRHPKNVYATLRQIADLGVLPRIIPAYGPLLRLLPAESVHSHTVGEHSLRVVREIERMREDSNAGAEGYAALFERLDRPEVLMLAALLHDAGKVRGGGHHAEVGAQMVITIGSSLGLDEEAVEALSFLVLQHDLMIDLVRDRHISQSERIARLVEAVGTLDRLNLLYLLSSADRRTLTADRTGRMKLDALARLHTLAARFLAESQPPAEDASADPPAADPALALRDLPGVAVREFCGMMPASYLLNTPQDEIVRHIGLLDRLAAGPVVEFGEDAARHRTRLTILTEDNSGLLARIAGALYAHGVNVQSARLFSSSGDMPVAIGEFRLDAQNRPLAGALRRKLGQDLLNVIQGSASLSDLLGHRGRELGPTTAAQRMRLHNDVSEAYTVAEVEMPDERGLLYRIAAAFAALNWNIHNARIGARAGETHDVFYLTDAAGQKLDTENFDLQLALSDGVAAGLPPVA